MDNDRTYAHVRAKARTGDVLGIEGKSLISRLIRGFTGGTLSHVGTLVWLGNGLFVAEFREFKGFQILPASLWVKDAQENGDNVYFMKAPAAVHEANLEKHIFDYRAEPYGYLSLVKIWLAQLFNVKISVRRKVCSTFVQTMWERAGAVFKRTADPSDFLQMSRDNHFIEPS